MTDETIHVKISNIIQSIYRNNVEDLIKNLQSLDENEQVIFFKNYYPCDLPCDVLTLDTIVRFVVAKQIRLNISGDSLIYAIKTNNVQNFTYLSNALFGKLKDLEKIIGEERIKILLNLFQNVLTSGNNDMIQQIISFFNAHNITPEFSQDYWDNLSNDENVDRLEQILDLSNRYNIEVSVAPKKLKGYPEQAKRIWSSYYAKVLG
jgi:hypothetical protein